MSEQPSVIECMYTLLCRWCVPSIKRLRNLSYHVSVTTQTTISEFYSTKSIINTHSFIRFISSTKATAVYNTEQHKLCERPPQYGPAPCKLTFDHLTLKVVSESRVTWATSVPILVFLGLSVLDLGPTYVTDRETDRRIY